MKFGRLILYLDLKGLLLRKGRRRGGEWEGRGEEWEGERREDGWKIGRSGEMEEGWGKGKKGRGHPLVLANPPPRYETLDKTLVSLQVTES